jgi:DNA (cytosine-5)-methyltransferase 1
LSVCSGVEAASVAWHDLGWTPVGFSEIEPFPSAVLAHRFPHVKNYGDMTKYKEWDIEPGTVDVLVGGTPCQSFSVAGLRKGLDDPRGNLMLVYLGLAERFKIPWLVWENVPGVLSSNGGRDFGTFLGALGELGYRWSFRVLDAQHFGVPQRRRRVFVIAHLGDGPHPAKVLFEPESLRGDTAKGGKKGKGTPRSAGKGAASGGRPFRMTAFGQYEDDDSGSTCKQRDYKDATDLVVQPMNVTQDTVAGPLDSHYWKGPGSRQGGEREYVGVVQPVTQLPIGLDEEQNAVVDGFGTLKARMLGGGFEGTVAVCATGHRTHNLDCAHGATEDGTGRGTPIVPCVTGSVTHTLKAEGFDGSEDGTGRGTPIVPAIAFHPTQDPISSVEVTHALGTGSKGGCATAAVATTEVTGTLSSRSSAAGGLGTDFEVAGGLQPVGFDPTGSTANVGLNLSPTLRGSGVAGNAGHHAAVSAPPMAVRRLLPVECERLQGFPDDWTNIPLRGKPAPDGPRYKAMGNSMAVPVMRWIGQRLDRVAKEKR